MICPQEENWQFVEISLIARPGGMLLVSMLPATGPTEKSCEVQVSVVPRLRNPYTQSHLVLTEASEGYHPPFPEKETFPCPPFQELKLRRVIALVAPLMGCEFALKSLSLEKLWPVFCSLL